MVGPSKILTVSYGTFSCTLEGFDDPFSTMKAIAEYFRDLAADDRYFGAEPPQPDAAMLHRIAEREVQRRVEAKINQNSVHLRAEEAADGAATPLVAPVVREPSAPSYAASAPVTAAPIAPAYVAAPPAHTDGAAPVESVAARLQRLRAAAAAAAAPVVTDFAAADPIEDAVEADPAPHPSAPAAAPVAAAEPAAPAEVTAVDEVSRHPVAASVADNVIDDAPAAEVLAAPSADLPAPDESAPSDQDILQHLLSPADDLHRPDAPDSETAPDLAATVALPPDAIDEAQDDADLIDDEPVAVQTPTPDDLIRSVIASDTAPEDAEAAWMADADALLPEAGPVEDEAEEDLIEADLPAAVPADDHDAAPTADAGANDETPDDTDAETLSDEASAYVEPTVPDLAGPDADTLQAAWASAAQIEVAVEPPNSHTPSDALVEEAAADHPLTGLSDEEATPDQATAGQDAPAEAADDADDITVLANRPAVPAEAAPVADEAATGGDPVPETMARLQRARARIIKIRRPDASAPETAADVAAPEAAVVPAKSAASVEVASAPADGATLTPEAEADLARELEQLRADSAPEVTARFALPEATAETSVQRLIDQTNSEMEGPENRRRLSAIAHLKAAVAATVADRRVTGGTATDETEESRINAYRNDLERVVRPRRPVSGTPATKPAPAPVHRPAPLVLVSAQRIDRTASTAPAPQVVATASAASPATPVRPRRVAMAPATLPAAALDETPDLDPADDDDIDAIDEVLDSGNLFADAQGFADFAERLGATTLPDLLEAAAAYATVVEGKPHLTRPQMLRQVLDALPAQDTPSREDVMRSFGTLLREGRIEKVRRGQFALRDDARYLEEGRKLAR